MTVEHSLGGLRIRYYVRPNRSLNSRHASRARNLDGVISPPRLRTIRESQRDSDPKPTVARNELPWVIVRQTSPTATRLWPIHAIAHDLGHNAVGVVAISECAPKVGVARQPWAGGRNPFGIVRGQILALCAELPLRILFRRSRHLRLKRSTKLQAQKPTCAAFAPDLNLVF